MARTLDFSWHPRYVWDNFEGVVLTSVGRTSTLDRTIEQPVAIAQQFTFKEVAQSGGAYVSQDLHWFLAGREFHDAVAPKVGDRITRISDGSEWTILDLSCENMDQVWDCMCRNFSLVERLTETVTILTPINRQDAALARVIDDMVPVQTGIPARIQEVSAETVDQRGRRLQQRTFTVYVGRRVTMTHEDLLEDASGSKYEFVSSESPDRIDTLQTITVRRKSDE